MYVCMYICIYYTRRNAARNPFFPARCWILDAGCWMLVVNAGCSRNIGNHVACRRRQQQKRKKKGFGLTCAPTGLGLAGTSIRRYCLGVPICQERPCVFSGADGRAGVYNVHG